MNGAAPTGFSPLFIGACVSTQSPLFIGACVSTLAGHLTPVNYYQWFQSPLHRGMCFDRNRQIWPLSPCVVSVPSSSGHVFRRGAGGRSRDRRRGFSPLFIGACVSTQRYAAVSYRAVRFQSPLHRGMCFDTTCRYTPSERVIGFSPLFIGACVSTGSKCSF